MLPNGWSSRLREQKRLRNTEPGQHEFHFVRLSKAARTLAREAALAISNSATTNNRANMGAGQSTSQALLKPEEIAPS